MAEAVDGMILDRPQLTYLWKLARLAPIGIAVEAGVYYGRSLAAWGQAREGRGQVVAVDLWKRGDAQREKFAANMRYAGLTVTRLECPSWDAPAMIGKPLAFVFVDADHSRECCARDIAAYAPLIMPRGILAFHDYGTWKGDVKGAVDAWQATAQWEQVGDPVGSIIAFYRQGE